MPWKRPTHDARLKKTRPKEHQPTPRKSTKIYGRAWRKARAAYLMKHPLCRECKKHGRDELATDLDHIIPHNGDMKLFWDFENNIQQLCRSCYSRLTAKYDGAFGRPTKPKPTGEQS